MLSTNYRLKLESICNKIAQGETVELTEMIWAEKLGQVNRTAATFLRQARRRAENPDMKEGSLDSFLNDLDLGSPDPTDHKTRFNTIDEIADFFKRDEEDGWRQRD